MRMLSSVERKIFGRPWSLFFVALYKGIWGLAEITAGTLLLFAKYFLLRTGLVDWVQNWIAGELADDSQDFFARWLLGLVTTIDYRVVVHVGILIIALGVIKVVIAAGIWFRSPTLRKIILAFLTLATAYGIWSVVVKFSFFNAVILLTDIGILLYVWHILPKHFQK